MNPLIIILAVLLASGCSGDAKLRFEIEKLSARLDSIEARSAAFVKTRRLQIVNDRGETIIEAASFPSGSGGELIVYGRGDLRYSDTTKVSKAKVVIESGTINPSIELVNADGEKVIRLVDELQGGNVHLFDFKGNRRMYILGSRSGGGLYGFSKEGNVVLSARVEGNTQMGNFKSFSDADKYNPVWVALTDEEMSKINQSGRPVGPPQSPKQLTAIEKRLAKLETVIENFSNTEWMRGVFKKVVTSQILITDDNDDVAIEIFAGENGNGTLRFRNHLGQDVMFLGAADNGDGIAIVFDRSGNNGNSLMPLNR